MKPLNGKSLEYIIDMMDDTLVVAADEPHEAFIAICAKGVSAQIPLDVALPHLTLAKAMYALLQDPDFCKLVVSRAGEIEQVFKDAIAEKLGSASPTKRTLN